MPEFNTMTRTLRCAMLATMLLSIVEVHATFSIVAFDPQTREVGSAVATCVADNDLGFFVSRFAPGQGAINAQSFASVPNLLNGRGRLLMGESAEDTLQWLIDNDVNGRPQDRQYAIVDLGDSDADHTVTFSGSANFPFAGGVSGDTYAIAGNILSGESIIVQMQAAFEASDGWLGERLMATLQAAKEPMADQRCANTSSLSAYISVTRADDALDQEFMRINTRAPNSFTDPIDLLQTEFDAFFAANVALDTDGDGVVDIIDNCTERQNPTQFDADGDGFGNACDVDFNDDCVHSFIDLGIMRSVFFSDDEEVDVNEDGAVNFLDLGILRELFFAAPGPSGYASCP
jgi:uncharacterized Ntn-hydrolase superfamily protein